MEAAAMHLLPDDAPGVGPGLPLATPGPVLSRRRGDVPGAGVTAAGLAVLLSVAACGPGEPPEEAGSGEPPAAAAQASDGRRAIAVPAAARETVLSEMRRMLEALNGVLTATVPYDREAVREAALSGGTRIAVDMDPAMAERLPDAFVRLGTSTHEDFDALAEAVAGGAPRDTVLSRLSRLTAKCVSCHAGYRLVTPD